MRILMLRAVTQEGDWDSKTHINWPQFVLSYMYVCLFVANFSSTYILHGGEQLIVSA